jgi:hypothetical protein
VANSPNAPAYYDMTTITALRKFYSTIGDDISLKISKVKLTSTMFVI